MNGCKRIIKKELDRVFRDRKLVFSLYLFPIFIMIGIYIIFQFFINDVIGQDNNHIPTIYIQNAPDEFRKYVSSIQFVGSTIYLEGDCVYIITSKGEETLTIEEIKEYIIDGKIDMLVSFEKDFLDKIENYEEGSLIPEIKTYYNPHEEYSINAREKFIEKVLTPFRNSVLKKRFKDLNQFKVFDIDRDSATSRLVDEEHGDTRMLSTLLPYLLIMLLFSGPMNLGIDVITGEKERGTMAWLLLTPIKRSRLVAGKLMAISILSILSSIVYSISMVLGLPELQSSDSSYGSVVLRASPKDTIELFLVMITLVYFYVTLVSLVSVYSKTVKEASGYMSSVYIVIILIGLLTMYATSMETSIYLFGVPVYGSALCIQKLTMGQLSLQEFGVNIISTLVFACILTSAITKAFYKEKVMFHA